MLEILFEPPNTEELYRIRGNWVHVQLGQIMDKKMQKDQGKKKKKSPIGTSEWLGEETRCQEQE